jgi:hypothetical protein
MHHKKKKVATSSVKHIFHQQCPLKEQWADSENQILVRSVIKYKNFVLQLRRDWMKLAHK